MLMEFDRVSFTYTCAADPALQQISLQIPHPGRYALIGRNGCGKTTLLRLANGLYRPQSGQIRWQGEALRYDHRSLNHLRQQIGLVFQDPEQQLVAGTVAEDLSYGLCNQGLPKAQILRQVHQTLQDFDLISLGDHPVNTLSLGQKKRLSIADIMILRPQLVLLDEPTAYLDPSQTQRLLQVLAQIQHNGTTLVIASHDLDFVYAWADHVYVMDHGEVVLEGDPDTIFAHHQLMDQLGLGLPPSLQILETLLTFLSQETDTLWAAKGERDLDESQLLRLKHQIKQQIRDPHLSSEARIRSV